MVRRPPSSTRTDTLFPHTTLFRSTSGNSDDLAITHLVRRTHQPLDRAGLLLECREFAQLHEREPLDEAMPHAGGGLVAHARFGKEIGRAHVRTPVTNAQLVCRLLLEKKKQTSNTHMN